MNKPIVIKISKVYKQSHPLLKLKNEEIALSLYEMIPKNIPE